MRFALLLLCGATALAGCGQQQPDNAAQAGAVNEPEVAQNPRGLAGSFDSPDNVVAAANQFGFRVDGYKQVDGKWQAAGNPITVADSQAKAPNRANFLATGPDAAKLDTLRFTLDLTDPADAERAKTRFATIVRDTLWQFRVEQPAEIAAAITGEKPLGKPLDGALAAVAIDPISAADKTRRITVTFTRPDVTGQAS